MAGRFYNESPSSTTHLKPMFLTSTTKTPLTPSFYSNNASEPFYNPIDPASHANAHFDAVLKHRIRILKLLSRFFGTLLSLATLVPLLLTIAKFLQTKDVYFTVDGKQRTAWAAGTITWYTYMYAGVAGLSLVLNTAVLVAYVWGVKHANRAATLASVWTWTVMLSHVVTWAVSAGIYRAGKEPVDGKFKDLWGWTCSTSAKELQSVLTSVDFEKYCGIQTTSFYTGVVNFGVGVLSLVILVLANARRTSKKRVKMSSMTREMNDQEPLRAP